MLEDASRYMQLRFHSVKLIEWRAFDVCNRLIVLGMIFPDLSTGIKFIAKEWVSAFTIKLWHWGCKWSLYCKEFKFFVIAIFRLVMQYNCQSKKTDFHNKVRFIQLSIILHYLQDKKKQGRRKKRFIKGQESI